MRKLRKRSLILLALAFLLMLTSMGLSTLLVHAAGNGKSYSRGRAGGVQLTGGDYPLFIPGICITDHSVTMSYSVTPANVFIQRNFRLFGFRYQRTRVATQWVVALVSLDFRVPLMWFGGLAAFAHALGPLERRWRRKREGSCLRCGYDLRGNVSEICPECGSAIQALPAD